MQTVFEGEIFDLIPMPDGLIFSYQKGYTEDNRIGLDFKMVSFRTGKMSRADREMYLLAKYGADYHIAEGLLNNYITAKALHLPSGILFACEKKGDAHLIEGDGTISWSGELKYRDRAPNGIALYKNSIWGCFAQNNVLIRFNPVTMREELRIGGIRSPFSAPCDIFVDGDTAVVSNMGSGKLIKVNLDSYTAEDYYEFEEPVLSYAKIENYEFVTFKSGLYAF